MLPFAVTTLACCRKRIQTPVLDSALRKNGLDVVGDSAHMTEDRPVVIFLHLLVPDAPAEKLATAIPTALG